MTAFHLSAKAQALILRLLNAEETRLYELAAEMGKRRLTAAERRVPQGGKGRGRVGG